MGVEKESTPLMAGTPPTKPSLECMFRDGKLPPLQVFEPFRKVHGLEPSPLRQLGIVVKSIEETMSRLEAVGFGPFLAMDLNVGEWVDGVSGGGRSAPRRITIPIALAWRDGIEIELIEVGNPNSGRYTNLKINDEYEFDHVAFLEKNVDEKHDFLTKDRSYKFVGEGIASLAPGIRVRFSYYDAGKALPGLLLELSNYEAFGNFYVPPDWIMKMIARLSKGLWLIVLIVETAIMIIFQAKLGVGSCNLHEATPERITFTVMYMILIVWGLHVGNIVCLQILFNKKALINPSLRRQAPGKIFLWHFLVCYLHTVILGPLFVAYGLRGWYWSSFIAMLFGSFPVVQFNYNPQSFGRWVGYFVVFRNLFELIISVVLAANGSRMSLKAFSVYHFWIWGYRFLDVGPRRLLRSWKVPAWFLWLVIAILYVFVPVILSRDLVMFVGEGVGCIPNDIDETKPLAVAGKILYAAVWYFVFHIIGGQWRKEIAAHDGVFDLEPEAPTYSEYRKSQTKHASRGLRM